MSGAPITIELGGKRVPMLEKGMAVRLAEELHAERRKALIADLMEAGICDAERVKALRELDAERGDLAPLIQWIATLRGSMRAIEVACEVNKLDSVAVLAGLSIRETISLGVSLVVPPLEKRAEGNAEAVQPESGGPSTTSA